MMTVVIVDYVVPFLKIGTSRVLGFYSTHKDAVFIYGLWKIMRRRCACLGAERLGNGAHGAIKVMRPG